MSSIEHEATRVRLVTDLVQRVFRGRIYILYGPPDEIESHPDKVEKWLYRAIPSLGKSLAFQCSGPEMRLKHPHEPLK